jgi:hypothetical protein
MTTYYVNLQETLTIKERKGGMKVFQTQMLPLHESKTLYVTKRLHEAVSFTETLFTTLVEVALICIITIDTLYLNIDSIKSLFRVIIGKGKNS